MTENNTALRQNPLLSVSGLEFGALPFDRIREDHYEPAFDEALRLARQAVDSIKTDSSAPTFENTIEALEHCSEDLDQVGAVFGNMLSAQTSEKLQEMARKILPEMAEFSNDIFLDARLFEKVKAVHRSRKSLKLDSERSMLLDKTYQSFMRNGAELDESGKSRLREIDQRLAVLGQAFSDNVLKATNDFELVLGKGDLAGLPEWYVEAAADTAKERGKEDAWVVTLDYPSFGPFLKFSERRDLRERLWRAYASRATNGDTDNRDISKEIARLRHERARLLGFETHAHFVLKERMASEPKTVYSFLDRLRDVSAQAAGRELDELSRFARESGLDGELRPWDSAFYSEKLKQKKFDFDEDELRPYFKLENVVAGVFEHARRLFGITFKPRPDLPVYHKDVTVYDVRNEDTGEHVGLFYADFFPRASKRGGAWMTVYRNQGLCRGRVERPHVSIVCNLTKPTPTKPSLLNLMEVRTVFHEFGHALHGLLTQCRYRSLSGTNVYWDFVELPSQIMENWVRERESLAIFARHYETGETVPKALVDKVSESSRFHSGLFSLRQLNFAYLDLAWHAADPSTVEDVEAFEVAATEKTRLLPHEKGTQVSAAFSHIFAGGYSAGYYSYKWAEVLDADAFEFFQEKGLFNREVADRFRENVLERGGTEHPAELYRRFRGRDADPDALLRRDGLHPTGLPHQEAGGMGV